MQRLVTSDDLEQYPELRSRGISANQMFDFDAYEATLEYETEENDNGQDDVDAEKNKLAPKKKAAAKKVAKKK